MDALIVDLIYYCQVVGQCFAMFVSGRGINCPYPGIYFSKDLT